MDGGGLIILNFRLLESCYISWTSFFIGRMELRLNIIFYVRIPLKYRNFNKNLLASTL